MAGKVAEDDSRTTPHPADPHHRSIAAWYVWGVKPDYRCSGSYAFDGRGAPNFQWILSFALASEIPYSDAGFSLLGKQKLPALFVQGISL